MIAVLLYTILVVLGVAASLFGLYKNNWKPFYSNPVDNPGLTLTFTGIFAGLIHMFLFLSLGPVWPVFAGIAWSGISLMVVIFQYNMYGNRTRTSLPTLTISILLTVFLLMGYWSFV